jgi:excisionase family DNA binding protein
MKSRPSQFGVRENTASSRQHASRLIVDSNSNAVCVEDESPKTQRSSSQNDNPAIGSAHPRHTASQHAATGRDERDERHLLTVHEVAELLRVPVSWVYGRMRKRSTIERLPGYRLGKYWRFREDEVLAWIACHREGSHAA